MGSECANHRENNEAFLEYFREVEGSRVFDCVMPAPTVLVVIAEGFEEIEAVTPINVLRRAGAEVTIAALAEGIHVTGRSGVTLHADTTVGAIETSLFDLVLLPGGPGVSRLRDDQRVLDLIARQHRANGWIAAICAAPVVLKSAGILGGKRFTAHFSVASELPALLGGERNVVDGKLITSRGAGTALEFGLLIVEHLFSSEKATEIAQSICA
jgi:4-methyl-5(b-hydroxyethyl)-thiazole monophosphate biosynthesis